MTKKQLQDLIYELSVKMEKKEEEARQHRDDMHHADGAAGEIQCLIWKLEEKLK